MYLDTPDSLSLILEKLELHAEVYVSGTFCGVWAVDTSGSRRMPFHLIGQGQAWLHFEDAEPQRLSTGDLILFPHDSPHIVTNSDQAPPEETINVEMVDDGSPVTNMVCGFFEFKDKAALPLLDTLPAAIVLSLQELSTEPAITQIIQLMVAELQQEQQGYYVIINQLAYLLFIHILRQQITSGSVDSGLIAGLFDKQIGPALNSIHRHPEKKWTLESLAKECAMGRSSFSQKFNQLVGMPAMQYLSYWRMQEATRMLKKDEKSIMQIAELCGYDSEASFSKAYKKITGTSPGSVKRSAQKHQ